MILTIFSVALAMAVCATIVHVWDAQSIVDEEIRRIAAERDAFSTFAKRVANTESAETIDFEPSTSGLVRMKNGPAGPLESVKIAYRETVMAVDHYEDDYGGESLSENLSAEFGGEVAIAVSDGQKFTPQLRTVLVQSSRKAAQDRTSLITILENEAEALTDSASTLEEINADRKAIAEAPHPSRSYEDLVDDWRYLGRLADRCDSLTSERQCQLRKLSAAVPIIDTEIHEYLYDELPVSHPVLADTASLAREIEELKAQLTRAITNRV